MTDYTQNTDFSVKDALPADDPEKLILGADLDDEFDEIQTAIASKYDSSDIASQAQAEAGTSNEVLMTPLRVSDLLSDSGGGGAGMLINIIALADPGDDRILFWDDSINAAAFLDIGTHLETTAGAVLNVTEATIDHDALLNFVANEHIDHSAVQAIGGSGISIPETDITADFTINLDINGLATETTLQLTADTMAFYDSTAAANRKITLDALVGAALGDGKWWRSGNQTMSAGVALTVVYNTADYDALELGAFNLTTGQYTAGSDGARVYISVVVQIDTIKDDETMVLRIQVDTVDQAVNTNYNAGNTFTSTNRTMVLSTTLNLAANEVVRVRVEKNVTADAVVGGIANTFISIIELG